MQENILVWLPSPLGDAVLCTPALRALRNCFVNEKIYFFASSTVQQILAGTDFCDDWIEQKTDNPFLIAKQLANFNFSHAILFKNSFASAFSIFLARIPIRAGYSRQGRGLFLTEKLYPAKQPNGKFKPLSMLDYYLAIASWLGGETDDRKMMLEVNQNDLNSVKKILPQVENINGPLVILVPGGAFGPSKCWLSERFSQTADWFIENYNAVVAVSVAPTDMEIKIADEICSLSKNQVLNLGKKNLSLGQLKALFSLSSLVITNDTGPRHIAIALQRKVVTLFGPNDPAWTDSGYKDEIQITGTAGCVPCGKSICKQTEHLCMESITVDMVCQAGEKLLKG